MTAFEVVAEKYIRANPKFIRWPDGGGNQSREAMNSWDLTPRPEGLSYQARVFYHPFTRGPQDWWVVVSLNINDSLRRIFSTQREAVEALNRIHPGTTKRTLWARGFRAW